MMMMMMPMRRGRAAPRRGRGRGRARRGRRRARGRRERRSNRARGDARHSRSMDRSRASECRRSVVVVVIARDGMFLRDAARKLESENARLDVAARERRRRREEEARRRDEIEKRKIEASRESSRAARDAKRKLEEGCGVGVGGRVDRPRQLEEGGL